MLKLDFTYDANLASMPTGETSEPPGDTSVEPPPPITMPPNVMMHRSTAVVSASVAELLPLQSPATDDLNLKIMSVKNVWEREHQGRTPLEQIFEQRYYQLFRVCTDPWKSWNLRFNFSRPGKPWNQSWAVESRGKSTEWLPLTHVHVSSLYRSYHYLQ